MHEWFAKRLEEAGVEHFPMHELRHTAGTEFHRASKDLKRTQMFMRHKSITTTATPICTSTARTSRTR
jgi:integrase